jgi:hypothetical protein
MARGNEYGVVFRGAEEIGRDKRRTVRYRVTWNRPDEDVERAANTRGFLMPEVLTLTPGDRVNLIRDGRGSIIAIDLTSA